MFTCRMLYDKVSRMVKRKAWDGYLTMGKGIVNFYALSIHNFSFVFNVLVIRNIGFGCMSNTYFIFNRWIDKGERTFSWSFFGFWCKFNYFFGNVCVISKVGKKVGNTHISQDGRKYWEIRLILNLQIWWYMNLYTLCTCLLRIV